MRTRIALVLALLAAACGDDTKGTPNGPDSGVDPDGGTDPDAPVAEATFTTYVIDLVVNQTANDTAPRPASEFTSLPDPDGDANNTAAYETLFQ